MPTKIMGTADDVHVVMYSGGHSSAIVAIEVVRRFGKENVVLLNHDMVASVEDEDIKRFKNAVSEYLGVPITYSSKAGIEGMDQFDVIRERAGLRLFTPHNRAALCTTHLKAGPGDAWMKANTVPSKTVVYLGFDANEPVRIQRRSGFYAALGYRSDYPCAYWERTILSTNEIGIPPPNTYSVWKHANCIGCLKAGRQHWYAVFVHRPDIFEKAVTLENEMTEQAGEGVYILRKVSLESLRMSFQMMKELGIPATEKIPGSTFHAATKQVLRESKLECYIPIFESAGETDEKPCECFV